MAEVPQTRMPPRFPQSQVQAKEKRANKAPATHYPRRDALSATADALVEPPRAEAKVRRRCGEGAAKVRRRCGERGLARSLLDTRCVRIYASGPSAGALPLSARQRSKH